MSFLMTILEKSGLVVAKAAAPGKAEPEKVVITTARVVSLRELVQPEGTQMAGPKGFKATPDDVFAVAKIVSPANGWTAEKVRSVAAKPAYKDMKPETRQKAILSELATAGADPEAIVADAVKRDEALDAYERFLEKKLADTKKQAAEQRKKLVAELGAVEGMLKQTEADFAAWKAAKQAKERELAEGLAPLMKDGTISLS
jgi:hypothetical protein